jgi:hypothetical protein
MCMAKEELFRNDLNSRVQGLTIFVFMLQLSSKDLLELIVLLLSLCPRTCPHALLKSSTLQAPEPNSGLFCRPFKCYTDFILFSIM